MAELYRLSFEEKIPGTKDVICPSIKVTYTQIFDGSPQGKKFLEYFNQNAMVRVQKVKKKALEPYKDTIKDTQKKMCSGNWAKI